MLQVILISAHHLTYKVQDDVRYIPHYSTLPLPALQLLQKPGTNFSHLLHIGEGHMVLSLVDHSATLWQVRVHPGVIHEVLNQHI